MRFLQITLKVAPMLALVAMYGCVKVPELEVSSDPEFPESACGHVVLFQDMLTVYVRLRDGQDDTASRRLHLISLYRSVGISPGMKLYNSSWSATFRFPKELIDVGSSAKVWKLDVPRVHITDLSGETYPTEVLFAEISLDSSLGFVKTKTVVLDKDRALLLKWHLGSSMITALPAENELGIHNFSVITSPCSSDVAMLLPSTNSSHAIYLGLTHTKFAATIWYDLTTNQYICHLWATGCSGLSVIDVVITSHRVVLHTNRGLLFSSDLRYQTTDKLLSFYSVLPPVSHTDTDWTSATLTYTPQCQARQHDLAHGEFLTLTFPSKKVDSIPLVFYSTDPYEVWDWLYPAVHSVPGSLDHVLSAKFNSHTGAVTVLYKTMMLNSSLDVRLLNYGSGRHVPFFPNHDFSTLSSIQSFHFHALTHFVYALGKEIWMSKDGGGSFSLIHRLKYGDVAEKFRGCLTGGALVVLTRAGLVLHGKSGINRLVEVQKLVNISSPIDLYMDNNCNPYIVLTSGNTVSKMMLKVQEALETYDSAFPHPLMSQILSQTVVVFYERLSLEDPGLLPLFHKYHENLLLSAKNHEGSAVIRNIQPITRGKFVTQVTAHVKVPLVSLTQKQVPALGYDIEVQGWTKGSTVVTLVLGGAVVVSGWQSSDVGCTVLIPGCTSFLLTSRLSNSVMEAETPVYTSRGACSAKARQWDVYDYGVHEQVAAWSLTEDSCQNHIQVDHPSKTMLELDVGDSTEISVITNTARLGLQSDAAMVYATLSNPWPFQVSSRWAPAPHGYQRLVVSLKHRLFRRGVTSVNFILATASLQCTVVAHTVKVYAGCPHQKRMVFWYPEYLTPDQILHDNPLDENGNSLLQNLPVNYRPPSQFGIDIPTSHYIYYADPSQARPRNHFSISQATGKLRQCHAKVSRAQCRCTDDMKLSADPKFTDCRERVYRMVYKANVPLNLTIMQQDKHLTPMEPFIVMVTELNGRDISGPIDVEEEDVFKAVKAQLHLNGSLIFHNPASLSLTLSGSGLYHLKAEIITGLTYCNLHEYFMIYVDEPPLAYPLPILIVFTVGIIIGGVLFVVYLWYLSEHHTARHRKTGQLCPDINTVIHMDGHLKKD